MKITTTGLDIAKQVFQVHAADLHPKTRIKASMIRSEKGERHVQRKAHGSGDDRGAEGDGGGPEGGGCRTGSGRIEAHDLRVEGEVRRDGSERVAGSQTIAGRKRAAEEAGGGLEFGQGRVAVGDPKKRMELAAVKAAVRQVGGWPGLMN